MRSKAVLFGVALGVLSTVSAAHATDKVTKVIGGTWRMVYMDRNHRTEGFYDGEVSPESYPDEMSCLIAVAKYATIIEKLATDYSHPEKLKDFEQRMSDMGLMPDASPSCALFTTGPWEKK